MFPGWITRAFFQIVAVLVPGFSASCFLENKGIFSCVAVLFLGFSPSCFMDNEGVFSPFSGHGFVVGFSGA